MAKPGKGEKTPGSGRQKGTLNKKSMLVAEKANLLGIDPIAITLYIAAGRWFELGYAASATNGVPTIPIELRTKAAISLNDFFAPKLKAIEHTGEDGGAIVTEVVHVTEWGKSGSDNEAP